MNDQQHEAISKYVRDVADRLLLADWEIRVLRDRCDDDYYATISVSEVETYASIRVGENFFDREPKDQRTAIAHELVHCHTARAKMVLYNLGENLDKSPLLAFATEAHRKELEILVQKLARLLAPTLPLPELPPGVHN